MEDNKAPTFTTANILAAFQRAQADFEIEEVTTNFSSLDLSPNQQDEKSKLYPKKRIGKTPARFKWLSKAIREQSNKETMDATTTAKFYPSLLASEGVDMGIDKNMSSKSSSSGTLTKNMKMFPEFPWSIVADEVVMPKEIQAIFKLKDNTFTFKDVADAILRTELGTGCVFKECSNWHRSTVLNLAGTIYTTTHQGNMHLYEPQVALFANPVLLHSFGFFCGPDKKLYSPVEVAQTLEDVRPDGVMGFFSVKTIEKDQTAVFSMLPNLEDLCTCLQLLFDLGVCLGTNEVLLPACVAEFKGTSNLTDLGKLAYEMDRIRQIHDMVWKVPPKIHYGIYIDGPTWCIRAIKNEGSNKPVRTVWTHTITSVEDALFVAAVIYRFAAYLLDSFMKLEPDYDRLKEWILKLAKEQKMEEKDLNDLKNTLHDIGKDNNSPASNHEEESPDDKSPLSPAEEDSLHIQQLCDTLVANGFSDIKLLKDKEVSKIFSCRKGNGLGAIKIASWGRIEKEATALRQLRGPGVEHLFMSGQIENCSLGYLIVERLYALPKHINSAYELQSITEKIMEALARIHQKNFIHRDVKSSNIMMDKNKNVKLIDFECAIHENAEQFDVFYGTNIYKPPELVNTHYPYGVTAARMKRAKMHGSVKADSYSAALVCAALMYDIELHSEDDVKMLIDWIDDRKLTHVAMESAVDLFRWMLKRDPAVRLSAAQALHHPFITESISKPTTTIKQKKTVAKSVVVSAEKQAANEALVDKENCSPNVIAQHV
eukprot:TRINITY_DN6046_c0_g1_i1.p1 TRINITY_DN6046_c0_g1~~TRINITY_DN6046_c0_g1_i1.p1  ORF type:complete len:768 (+),score=96.80 TRINITY_DN6046_c0_g1_i1:197-2500(+)